MIARLFLLGVAVLALSVGQAEAQSPCPEAQNFIDVSRAAGSGSLKPQLRVECTPAELIVTSNGIPSFRYVQATPNPLREQRYVWRIPRQPRPAPEPRQVPLLGPIAVAVDGLPIFGPNEAPEHGTADPYLDKLLDYCNGHTAQRGDYHFHVRPNCLFDTVDGRTSLVVGYAFDGYPILAPFECTDAGCTSVRKVASSWRRENANRNAWMSNRYVEGHGTLDRCNGMTRPDGSYAYYATDTFPYFLACYRGVASNDQRMEGRPFGKGGPPPPMKGQPK